MDGLFPRLNLFVDLGFQVSYLVSGDNMRTPGERFITGATFFLDF